MRITLVLGLAAVHLASCVTAHDSPSTGARVVEARPALSARPNATIQPSATPTTAHDVVSTDPLLPARVWLPLRTGCVRANFEPTNGATGRVRIGPVELDYALSATALEVWRARWSPVHNRTVYQDCKAAWPKRVLAPAGQWLQSESECWTHFEHPDVSPQDDCTGLLAGPWPGYTAAALVPSSLRAFTQRKEPMYWRSTPSRADHCGAWEVEPSADFALRGELVSRVVVDGVSMRRTRNFVVHGQVLHVFGGADTRQVRTAPGVSALAPARPNGTWLTFHFEPHEHVVPSYYFHENREACLRASEP